VHESLTIQSNTIQYRGCAVVLSSTMPYLECVGLDFASPATKERAIFLSEYHHYTRRLIYLNCLKR